MTGSLVYCFSQFEFLKLQKSISSLWRSDTAIFKIVLSDHKSVEQKDNPAEVFLFYWRILQEDQEDENSFIHLSLHRTNVWHAGKFMDVIYHLFIPSCLLYSRFRWNKNCFTKLWKFKLFAV